jgi:fructan beta-fructosidase
VSFEKGFAAQHTSPRFSTGQNINLRLIIDKASVELFADDGLSVMTGIFFPDSDYSAVSIQSADPSTIGTVQISSMKSIYQENAVAFQ